MDPLHTLPVDVKGGWVSAVLPKSMIISLVFLV